MREIRPWAESLVSLRKLAEVSEELALVFVSGPGELAEEGLAQLDALLHETHTVIRHRLTPESADLAAILSQVSDPQKTALLVHGLEGLAEAKQLSQVARSLNLGRDALGAFDSLIVLWIPKEDLGEFRSLCPDLFHWRSLVMTVSAGELRQDIVTRWRYLDSVMTTLASSLPAGTHSNVWLKVEVGGRWGDSRSVEIAPRGYVAQEPSDEKLFDQYAWRRLQLAREDTSEPIPLRLSLEMIATDAEGDVLSPIVQAVRKHVPFVSQELVALWAQRGDFLWLIRVDREEPGYNHSLFSWLSHLLVSFPGNYVLFDSFPPISNPAHWSSVELASEEQRQESAEFEEDPERASQRTVSALIRSLDPAFEPSASVRRGAARALGRVRNDSRVADALIRSLNPGFEDDHGVWEIAALSLPEGDPRALDILLQHLNPAVSELSRYWVARAIAVICQRNRENVERLSRLLDPQKEPNPEIRNSIVECIELALGPEVSMSGAHPVHGDVQVLTEEDDIPF